MLAGRWRPWKLPPEEWTGSASFAEQHWGPVNVKQKLPVAQQFRPRVLGVLQAGTPLDDSYTHVRCSVLHNRQMVEATQIPINGQIDKENVAHNGILFSLKKLTHAATWVSLESILPSEINLTQKNLLYSPTCMRQSISTPVPTTMPGNAVWSSRVPSVERLKTSNCLVSKILK